jgi:trigger factor
LQNEVNLRQKRNIRNQLVQALSDRVQFDMPESSLAQETRSVVYEMVSENQRRGVTKEAIEAKKDEIYNFAAKIAKDRLKISFLFHKISEKEGIRVDPHELNSRIAAMAQASKTPVQKLVQQLQKQGGMEELYQQIIHEKVLSFLHENAKIEDAPQG